MSVDSEKIFRQGLRLLHSRNRDSADQLRSLVDELIRIRQGKSIMSIKLDPLYRRDSPAPRSRQGSPVPFNISKREDYKRDFSGKGRDDDLPLKKMKLETPGVFKSHTPSPTPSIKSESSSRSRKSDDSDLEENYGLELEITDGINCTVCKTFEVSAGNQLLECQECHSLYHQECHKPAIPNYDVNDARHIWYCSKCSKTIKKQNAFPSSGPGNSSSHAGSSRNISSGNSANLSSKSVSVLPLAPSPGRNSINMKSSVFNYSSGRSSGLSSSTGSTSSMSSASHSKVGVGSSSSAKTTNPPPNSMISAEKRMQNMKKKAAAKLASRNKL